MYLYVAVIHLYRHLLVRKVELDQEMSINTKVSITHCFGIHRHNVKGITILHKSLMLKKHLRLIKYTSLLIKHTNMTIINLINVG